MLPEEEEGADRPKAVTIIGRLWLVVAVFGLCKAIVNLAIWKVIQPDAPSLFGDIAARSPLPFLRPLLGHLTALMTAQALWWAFVGVAAIGLLRLRPWGRLAMEAIGWALLAYTVGFVVLWTSVWPTLPARTGSAPVFAAVSNRVAGLAVALAACAVLAGASITMIVLLRKPRVREAFARARDLQRVG